MSEPVQHWLQQEREEPCHQQWVQEVGDTANTCHDDDGAGGAKCEEEQAPPGRRQIESGLC